MTFIISARARQIFIYNFLTSLEYPTRIFLGMLAKKETSFITGISSSLLHAACLCLSSWSQKGNAEWGMWFRGCYHLETLRVIKIQHFLLLWNNLPCRVSINNIEIFQVVYSRDICSSLKCSSQADVQNVQHCDIKLYKVTNPMSRPCVRVRRKSSTMLPYSLASLKQEIFTRTQNTASTTE